MNLKEDDEQILEEIAKHEGYNGVADLLCDYGMVLMANVFRPKHTPQELHEKIKEYSLKNKAD